MNDRLDLVRSFLRGQTTLAVATVNDDGTPRNTPLFYINDDQLNLYWFSSRSSPHSRNCLLRPQSFIAISGDARTWQHIQGVQMEGRVSIITDRALRKSVSSQYIERFALGNLFSLAIRRSSLFCFTPGWIRFIDNTVHFGYKLEFELSPLRSSQ